MYVERDYENLRVAAREAFEEGWAMRGVQRRLLLDPQMANRAEFIRKSLPARTLAEGYYLWTEYLLWLSAMHEVVSFRNLTATEAEGIRIVRAARDEFAQRVMRCFKCGAVNEKSAIGCSDCGQRFTE